MLGGYLISGYIVFCTSPMRSEADLSYQAKVFQSERAAQEFRERMISERPDQTFRVFRVYDEVGFGFDPVFDPKPDMRRAGARRAGALDDGAG